MQTYLTKTADEQRELFLSLATGRDIADLLQIPYSKLTYHLYSPAKRVPYTLFLIKKRSGGVRQILASSPGLKNIQRRLNEVLQNVYTAKPSVHGFTIGRGIVSNATAHQGRRFVLNLDLKDFFPSINFGRVRGMFMARPYNLSATVATVLARICCYENMLPQGAPTSPVISNMICARMDSALQRLAKKAKCTYTRYADDITFSTSLANFPSALAFSRATETKEELFLGGSLLRVIEANGFIVNPTKLRLKHRAFRQEVTGLTVNRFPNVQRKYLRQIRAMLHAWRKFGLEKAAEVHFARHYRKQREPSRELPNFSDVIRGRIEFVRAVRGDDSVYRQLYKEFLVLTNKRVPWESVELFFSYAHEDEKLRDSLARHLAQLQREKIITAWHDRCINAGTHLDKEIDLHLNSAGIILLLVSASFMNSEYCCGIELKAALRRHELGEAVVIPVILRDCDWTSAPFAKLRAAPKDGRAITGRYWKNCDEAFTDVAKDVREVASRLKSATTVVTQKAS